MSLKLEYFDGPTGRQNVANLLVTEGADDAIFLNELLKSLEADTESVGICYVGGDGELEKFCSSLSKSSAFTAGEIQSIIVFRDADQEYEGTLQRCSAYFSKFGAPAPGDGEVVRHEGRTYGLFLFPDASSAGRLEDLLLLAPTHGAQVESARAYIQAAQRSNGLDRVAKRVVQAYLASAPITLCAAAGRGIRNGAFDVDAEQLGKLKQFLLSALP